MSRGYEYLWKDMDRELIAVWARRGWRVVSVDWVFGTVLLERPSEYDYDARREMEIEKKVPR